MTPLPQLGLAILISAVLPAGEAAPIVGLRGDGSGVFAAKGLPTTWDVAAGTNVLWSTPLPECALSEAVAVAGKVLVTCEPEILACYDAATGKESWKVVASALDGEAPDKQAKAQGILKKVVAAWKSRAGAPKDKNDPLVAEIAVLRKEFSIQPLENALFGWQGYAYNPPFSDGTSIWVRFGTGAIGCYDFSGKKIWLKRLPPQGGINHLSTHMMVAKSRVIFVDNDAEKKMFRLTGLDAKTGAEVWHSKPFPPGDHSGASGLTSVQVGGTMYLATSGGQIIDADSGEIVGEKFGNWGYCHTVQAADGALWFGPRRIRLKKDGARIVSDDPLPVGKTSERVVAYDGMVYVNRMGALHFFDAAQALGEEKTWPKLSFGIPEDKAAGRSYRSMPIVADGLIFCPANQGRLVVLKPGPKPAIVATNVFPDPIMASPTAIDGKLFVRTASTLYCLGKR